jgi:hypothetical protein
MLNLSAAPIFSSYHIFLTERLPPKGGRFKTSGGLSRRLKDYAPKGGGFYRLPPSAAKAVLRQ